MADSVETPAADVSPYLKQARIRDYPPLRDAGVNFKPGLNIIIGPNGSGKTRFIELVSKLIHPYQVHERGTECELELGGYDGRLTITFHEPEQDPDPLVSQYGPTPPLEVRVQAEASSGSSDDFLSAIREAGLDYRHLYPILAHHGVPLKGLPLVDASATFAFGEMGRIRLDPPFGSSPEAAPLLVGEIFNAFTLVNAKRPRRVNGKAVPAPSTAEAQALTERIVTAYLAFLNPFLKQHSPIGEVRLSRPYQIFENLAQRETLVKGLVFEYLVAASWLPFEALSDGTKRILYLISQLVMPWATSASSITTPPNFSLHIPVRIIFLEEPELGIHPVQLAKLLSLIKEVAQTQQVIMTTHAPQVLDMLGADELDRITICSLDPEKGTQFHKLTEAKQEQARVYMKEVGFLSDYWRYSYLEETEAK